MNRTSVITALVTILMFFALLLALLLRLGTTPTLITFKNDHVKYAFDFMVFMLGIAFVWLSCLEFYACLANLAIHKKSLFGSETIRPVAKVFYNNVEYHIFAFDGANNIIEYRTRKDLLTKDVLAFLETIPHPGNLRKVKFKELTRILSNDFLPHAEHRVYCLEIDSVTDPNIT